MRDHCPRGPLFIAIVGNYFLHVSSTQAVIVPQNVLSTWESGSCKDSTQAPRIRVANHAGIRFLLVHERTTGDIFSAHRRLN